MVVTDSKIIYKDLIDSVLKGILSSIHNLTAYSASVPDYFKPGYVLNVPMYGLPNNGSVTTKTRYTRSADAALEVVTENTIVSQFNTFLKERAIYDKMYESITTEGLFYFYDNLIIFLENKVQLVSASKPGNNQTVPGPTLLFYNGNAPTTFPSSSFSQHTQMTDADVYNFINNINIYLNTVVKIHPVHYVISYVL